MYIKSQVTDYSLRGYALDEVNVYDFFMDTWEKKEMHEVEGANANLGENRGRPRNERVRYLSSHPAFLSNVRVLRTTPHNNIPNFVGSHFPRSDDSTKRELYCGTMLIIGFLARLG